MLEPGFLLALLGTVLLAGGEERRRASLGLVLLALAIAALRTAGIRAHATADESGFEAINGGLLLGGIAFVLAGASAALLRAPGWRTAMSSAAAGFGCLVAAWGARPDLRAAPIGRTIGASILVGLLAEGLIRLSSRPRGSTPLPSRSERELSATGWALLALLAAATLAVAAGPHLVIVFAGAGAAACAGYLLLRAMQGGEALPVLPILTLLLIPTGWLMATIAGPEGLSMSALPDLPLSPAAQILLAPALFLVAYGFAGLWPFHRQVPVALLAPAAALLLIRVGIAALPEGMEHWRALAFPLLVAGLWHAALNRRASTAAAAGALLAIGSLAPAGIAASAWMLAGALLVRLSEWTPWPGASARWALDRAGWVAIGWGGLLALGAGLRAEVVYSVAGALGAAVGLVIPPGQAITPADSRTGEVRS